MTLQNVTNETIISNQYSTVNRPVLLPYEPKLPLQILCISTAVTIHYKTACIKYYDRY